ncbi:hypothetical protein [Spirillospora sp. CA-128828]|uniref:hypothetical protein n=1 Tax=Spirillospora sp. CA-128828 TaxID=3240033 RepID=UPI003D92E59B
MIGNASHDRDELLVTGIPPVGGPLAVPSTEPVSEPTAELEAAPVFVDATGWRARVGRRLGLLAGALLIVFLGALGLGMTTGADVPLTPWSGPSAHPRVKVSPPRVPAGKTGRPPSAAKPRPTTGAEAPAPPAALGPSSTPTAPSTTITTAHPGKSQADPPAWGRKKKNR